MAKRGSGRDEMKVVLPSEPPELNPGAARALLGILLKAYEKVRPPVRERCGVAGS